MTTKAGDPNVLEIDAIGVDEWEHEQHTPRAIDENLAALVKQSGTQSGPTRAPTIDDGWGESGEPKQRTTTNTVSRPAPPKPKTKTMALPSVVAPKPSAVPQPIARVETKAIVSPGAKPGPKQVVAKPPVAKGTGTLPRVTKPTAKPTPPPMAVVEPKPAAKPTPPPMAVIEPKPAAAPKPLPPMTLPAWPPTTEFEDWDNPQSAATSVGNRVSPARPVSSDFKPEDSVIVDLNAKPTGSDKPRRPQTYPVIQTSEQNPSTSGVFVMPTAAQPNATQVAPERVSAPELPPPPVALIPVPDRASSPGWNTPLPQPLPGEPPAAPAALAPPTIKRPLLRSRGVVIGIAAAAVLAIVFAISSSHDAKPEPTLVATAATTPTKPEHAVPPHASQAPSAAMPARAATPAAAEPVAPTTASPPAKKPVAMRRISRSKKPVVVDYDKKPSSSPLDDDQALAQARAAYASGNQHLFAGEGADAVADYRRALAVYPSYAAGYRGLGLAFAQQGDKPSAIAAFKTYVKLAPTAKDVALIQKRIRNLSVH